MLVRHCCLQGIPQLAASHAILGIRYPRPPVFPLFSPRLVLVSWQRYTLCYGKVLRLCMLASSWGQQQPQTSPDLEPTVGLFCTCISNNPLRHVSRPSRCLRACGDLHGHPPPKKKNSVLYTSQAFARPYCFAENLLVLVRDEAGHKCFDDAFSWVEVPVLHGVRRRHEKTISHGFGTSWLPIRAARQGMTKTVAVLSRRNGVTTATTWINNKQKRGSCIPRKGGEAKGDPRKPDNDKIWQKRGPANKES
jgi:hypothetical protein